MALGTLHSFSMHRGDSRKITGTVVDENGAVIDLTGLTGTALSWILANRDKNLTNPAPRNDALVTKTIGSGITITDATGGKVEVALDEADTTARKAPADYYQELQIVLSGETTTVMFGIISLRRDIVVPGP